MTSHGVTARYGAYNIVSLNNFALSVDSSSLEAVRRIVPSYQPDLTRASGTTLVLCNEGNIDAVYTMDTMYNISVILPVYMSRGIESMQSHVASIYLYYVASIKIAADLGNVIGFRLFYYSPSSMMVQPAEQFILRKSSCDHTIIGGKLPCMCNEYSRHISFVL